MIKPDLEFGWTDGLKLSIPQKMRLFPLCCMITGYNTWHRWEKNIYTDFRFYWTKHGRRQWKLWNKLQCSYLKQQVIERYINNIKTTRSQRLIQPDLHVNVCTTQMWLSGCCTLPWLLSALTSLPGCCCSPCWGFRPWPGSQASCRTQWSTGPMESTPPVAPGTFSWATSSSSSAWPGTVMYCWDKSI